MDVEAGATRYALTVLTYLLAVTTYAVSLGSRLFMPFLLIFDFLSFFLGKLFERERERKTDVREIC